MTFDLWCYVRIVGRIENNSIEDVLLTVRNQIQATPAPSRTVLDEPRRD